MVTQYLIDVEPWFSHGVVEGFLKWDIARAIASRPAVVLADEPTANVDSETAENLLDIMEKLNKERGVTFLFSTHDHRVMERARRIVKLVDGRVASDESLGASS